MKKSNEEILIFRKYIISFELRIHKMRITHVIGFWSDVIRPHGLVKKDERNTLREKHYLCHALAEVPADAAGMR
jgi:hypothetical protein